MCKRTMTAYSASPSPSASSPTSPAQLSTVLAPNASNGLLHPCPGRSTLIILTPSSLPRSWYRVASMRLPGSPCWYRTGLPSGSP